MYDVGTVFQSTRPAWGATSAAPATDNPSAHFNPRAPYGARRRRRTNGGARSDFNPRAPCGARPIARLASIQSSEFQSTRPMRGATLRIRQLLSANSISIHAPHAGRDRAVVIECGVMMIFQSTRPVWGATQTVILGLRVVTRFQSTRPVWGATRYPFLWSSKSQISIHAPRMGRDMGSDGR